MCCDFEMGRMNDAGRYLIEWCEANGLAYANSFVRHTERGTWFNRMYGRWYELDGFVVRQNERHSMIRRMRCERMNELSDHKPKKVVICVEKRRWRAVNGERNRRIKWEVLRDSEKKEEYKESTRAGATNPEPRWKGNQFVSIEKYSLYIALHNMASMPGIWWWMW